MIKEEVKNTIISEKKTPTKNQKKQVTTFDFLNQTNKWTQIANNNIFDDADNEIVWD